MNEIMSLGSERKIKETNRITERNLYASAPKEINNCITSTFFCLFQWEQYIENVCWLLSCNFSHLLPSLFFLLRYDLLLFYPNG